MNGVSGSCMRLSSLNAEYMLSIRAVKVVIVQLEYLVHFY